MQCVRCFYLRLLLGFVSSTQDGADGLISEPSRGPGEPHLCPFCLVRNLYPGQTRVRAERKHIFASCTPAWSPTLAISNSARREGTGG